MFLSGHTFPTSPAKVVPEKENDRIVTSKKVFYSQYIRKRAFRGCNECYGVRVQTAAGTLGSRRSGLDLGWGVLSYFPFPAIYSLPYIKNLDVTCCCW
jgi:hypothetical protein